MGDMIRIFNWLNHIFWGVGPVAMLSVRSVYSPWIVLRKRVGIRPLLIDKLSSYPDPKRQDPIAPEGFVLLSIVNLLSMKGSTINMKIKYRDLVIEAEVS